MNGFSRAVPGRVCGAEMRIRQAFPAAARGFILFSAFSHEIAAWKTEGFGGQAACRSRLLCLSGVVSYKYGLPAHRILA